MCGIVGAYNYSGNAFKISEDYIRRMRDTMVHRGPDGAGIWIDEKHVTGFGHRRLAIIDLDDKASQPMRSNDGRYVITYNGEIYNHVQLRKELTSLDATPWQTDHSDTEVILRAFQYWGIECVHHLRGMFAFAVWDNRESTLWLVRDRLGIKPLYYSFHDGRITFASEIKALLADPEQQRNINEQALYDYLSFLTTPPPQTLFEGIYKLPSASWIKIGNKGTRQEKRYWDVYANSQQLHIASDEDAAELVLTSLRDVIQLHKAADVPLGVFLSGGLDSSTNAILFSEHEQNPVNTFSIAYRKEYASYEDESEYAQFVANKIVSNHSVRMLESRDVTDFLPEMIWHQDEPIADPVCVPVYYVSQMARNNDVKVCQVGEGADELFCGYPGWLTLLNLQKVNTLPVPSIFKKAGLGLFRMMGKERKTWYELLRRSSMNQSIFWGGAEAFSETHKQKLLSPRMKSKFSTYSSWESVDTIWKRFRDSDCEHSFLNWMGYLDLNLRLPELLLMRVDKMSMATSLETRVPFLDHVFVEQAMRLPSEMKIKGNELKHILKSAVKGIVPDQIINRKKQGFGIPMQEWFEQHLAEHMSRELSYFCNETDLLDKNELKYLFDNNRGPQLWYLCNLAMWWRKFIAV